MEKDLKEIEKMILQFCKDYNCTVEAHSLSDGRRTDGTINVIKICFKIQN